jgi:hypothetical protein
MSIGQRKSDGHPHRKQVLLPIIFIEWAREFAKASFAQCRDGKLNRFTYRPITEKEFYVGKLAECAAANHFWVIDQVQWEPGPDNYYDLVIGADDDERKYRVDVKGSLAPFMLIWPVSKNEDYFNRSFDLLLSVTVPSLSPPADATAFRCFVEGFVTKSEFAQCKHVADGSRGQPKLDAGTWYMPKRELHDVGELKVRQFK